MSDQELAAKLRAGAEAHPDAPEGLDLFRWFWVSDANRAIRFPVQPQWMNRVESAVSPRPAFSVIEVAPKIFVQGNFRAAVGWNRHERVAVLFFANGGTLPERVRPRDAGMHDLADSGNEIRARESADAWLKLLDDLGLSEGEEWKRG